MHILKMGEERFQEIKWLALDHTESEESQAIAHIYLLHIHVDPSCLPAEG